MDLRRNKKVPLILKRLEELDEILSPLRSAEKELKELKTELQKIMGTEELATFPGYEITNKLQKRPATAACEFFVLRWKKVNEAVAKLVKKAA